MRAFNQLPSSKIHEFIKNICARENLPISDTSISVIQNLYRSDIRSMINFIQLNQNIVVEQNNILNEQIWKTLSEKFQAALPHNTIKAYLRQLSIYYNIDNKQIIKDYFNYLIKTMKLNSIALTKMEQVLHNFDCHIDVLVDYFILVNMDLHRDYFICV